MDDEIDEIAAAGYCEHFCMDDDKAQCAANVHRPRVSFDCFAESLNEREFRKRFRVDK